MANYDIRPSQTLLFVYAKATEVNARKSASTSAAVIKVHKQGDLIGLTTGYVYKDAANAEWYEIYQAKNISETKDNKNKIYCRFDVITLSKTDLSVQTTTTYIEKPEIKNFWAYAIKEEVIARATPYLSGKIVSTHKGGDIIGIATSRYYTDTLKQEWYEIFLPDKKVNVYCRFDVVSFSEKKLVIPDVKAQEIVDGITGNDLKTVKALAASRVNINKAKASGVNTAAHEKTMKELEANITARQSKLSTSKLIKTKQFLNDAKDALTVNMLAQYPFLRLFGMSGLGVVPAFIIGAIAAVGVGVSIYFAFSADYDRSKVDLVVSTDLEKALSTLPKAKAKSVKADLENQIDDAYNQGKTDQKVSSFFSLTNPIFLGVLAVGGAVVYNMVQKPSKK